jgi:predicted DNA-binding protein
MKKLFLPSLIFTAFVFFMPATSGAQDFETPVGYMDFISKQQINISKRFLSYNSAASHGKRAKKVDNLRTKLMDEVQDAKMNISSMPSFKGSKSYRDSAVSFMKLYYNVLNEDYGKIINMEEVAEQSYDLMEAYLLAKELVEKKLHTANEQLRKEEELFAKNNNVNLINTKDELSEMMEQVGEANQYYHTLYLIFFKSYKQEAYLMEAIEKKNINGIEQNKNTLLQYAQDGLKKLDGVKPFKGDNSLVSNCKRLLEFYVKEVNEKIPAVTDYFLMTESFEKLKKDFDKKSSPSKDDVDNFNKGVKEVNAGVNSFNATMKTQFDIRKELLNNWNDAVEAYFDITMPHYK